jgi:hypothetical protein
MTDEPADPNRPNNLCDPVPGDHGAHGTFDARSRDFCPQLRLDKNRDWLALAGVGLAALTCAAWVGPAGMGGDDSP